MASQTSPPFDPLEWPRLRLDRAWTHLEAVNDHMGRWLARDPYLVVQETNPETGDEEWFVRIRESIPRDLRLLISDCITNMRACLDNLAWNYALLVKKKPSGSTCFLITKTAKEFGNESSKIKDVQADARRAMKDLQPYMRTNEPTTDPLWVLNRLWNDDKHRVPALVGSIAVSSQVHIVELSGPMSGFAGPNVSYGAFEDGDKIAWLGLSGRTPETKVDVNAQFAFGIAFDQAGPAKGALAVPFLVSLHHFVRDELFRRFEEISL
jgi:hypothetical protein